MVDLMNESPYFLTMQVLSFIRRPFRYKYTNISLILILINVLCFFFRVFAPRESLYYFAMIPARVVADGAFWQLLTYMFFHANLSHLFFNMLGLFFFGFQVEQRMGSSEFLLFYLFSGLIAGLFSFVVYYLTGAYGIILLGASGAIYAILLAFAVFFPHAMIYVMGIIPVRAPVLVMIYAGIEIFSQVFNVQGGVAHLTHLAGLAAAWVYLWVRLRIDPLAVFLNRRY
jgi:membrane associated rhomboid family serine protease